MPRTMRNGCGVAWKWRRTARPISTPRPSGRSTSRFSTDQGRELHRMTTALQLMPGETLSCIGCHEHRHTAPPVPASDKVLLASRRAAKRLNAARVGRRRRVRLLPGRAAGARQVLRGMSSRAESGRRIRSFRRQDTPLQYGVRQSSGPKPFLSPARHGDRQNAPRGSRQGQAAGSLLLAAADALGRE